MLNGSFIILNGIVLTLQKISFAKINIPDKVIQLSCGMKHCIVRTSLKKVYSWGDNSVGQLGHGNYRRFKQPKII
jgi:alpha-tubulin suppressor-like RCC1 family protein